MVLRSILITGRLRVLGAVRKSAQAVLVVGGRIALVGSRRSLARQKPRGARTLDLGDATITPGLVDCHTHFFYWALGRSLVAELSDLFDWPAVERRLERQCRRQRVGDWVVARGLDVNRWDGQLPTATQLDRVVADAPLIIHTRDGHTACLNTCAMQRAGLTKATPDPKGGVYLRDERGRPTGVVQEAAIDLLPDPLRELARRTDGTAQRTVDRALDDAERMLWSLGIVGVHTMDDGASLTHMQRRHAAGRLGVRVLHAVQRADFDAAVKLGLRSGFGDDWLRIGGLKIFADGALGSQTAYMYDAYPQRPGFHGVPVFSAAELEALVARAAEQGWASWIHAIGDRAVHDVISAMIKGTGKRHLPLPHRIEHTQCIRPGDVRRMARAGIVASVQPCHLLGDIVTADRHWPRARKNTYAFRSLLDAGVRLACGSDMPIESPDPRRSLHGAVCRTDEQGTPAGGWFAAQRISAEDVLRGFAQGAAVSAGKPVEMGTIVPGAPADFTIWEEDPARVRSEELLTIGIRGCVVGGEVHLAD